MSMPTRLTEVVERLGRMIDARAAEVAEDAAAARARSERLEREAFLERERITLRPEIRHKVVNGVQLPPTPSLKQVRQWLQRPYAPVLVLGGGTGCGKSVAAMAAAVARRRSARWRTATDLVRTFAALFGHETERETIMQCGLLVIDDVGFETEPERCASALVEVLERRGKDSGAYMTILTSNATREALDAHYQDERLASRWNPAAAQWAYSDGEDLRRSPLAL